MLPLVPVVVPCTTTVPPVAPLVATTLALAPLVPLVAVTLTAATAASSALGTPRAIATTVGLETSLAPAAAIARARLVWLPALGRQLVGELLGCIMRWC